METLEREMRQRGVAFSSDRGSGKHVKNEDRPSASYVTNDIEVRQTLAWGCICISLRWPSSGRHSEEREDSGLVVVMLARLHGEGLGRPMRRTKSFSFL